MISKISLLILAVIVLFIAKECSARGCTRDRLRQGCRIQDGYCLCGFGCDSDYRYVTRNDCIAALRGHSRDACSRNPCRNGGHCTQKSDRPWFSCHCAGTGYYGQSCETRCPNENAISGSNSNNYPVECIVI